MAPVDVHPVCRGFDERTPMFVLWRDRSACRNAEVELFAPMGYDAVMVFIEAMKRAGSSDPAKFLPEISKTNYNGVIGPIAFDEKGDLTNGPITIYVVKGGKWEALETVTPNTGANNTSKAEAPKDAAKK